ncbi:hypothetical protein KNV09_gp049 [Vibrio phage Athena]|uniref:Uncharacterized protein n=3 Tax=Thalassavirus TaxID=2948922 RepID=A0A6M4EUF2_9CAUD|nr:hypothetical protein KNU87_gp047 [Vibrio phage Bennett]YP_010108285.1 hypothetical protein KNV07_gp049 [Vibrio phage Cody]YP_010108674.1 hypothetical protein KNV09_gp049 [Vibrio phage Athena]QKE60910.1 hypothetical protein DAX_49 [Vibrio phage Dax]QKN84516.1 hypothetical protein BBMUFFIN_50 [Vibrio phage BBMuffin]QKN85490.1 hypothetical protein DIREPILLOW8_51 [Vibrio phage Direpillow8]WBU76287.1 hypothetical protein WYMAN_48 [Vibrio phage Wyman]WBU76856.1 hypothetical protein KRONOS_50 [V
MNKVESFLLDGSLPTGMRSVGFYITQAHIEEVGKGLKLRRDFDMCYYNEGGVTHENIGKGVSNGDTPWLDCYDVLHDQQFTMSDVEVVFGDELELPEGYKVYWISIQPEQEVKVAYAIRHKTDCPQGKWFIPES